ncbi:MAG: metal ABC transporter permease [Kiritimatiellae bacterium]|jgi:ABC-type Mn2+/Zn2+ transport system permease subunit|nr:metal ABC transporter permease [Kiritimatiellia bacterium]
MMEALLDTLNYTFNQRALLAAAMIGFLNGFFGAYVVLRRKALFAGALSHTLFPGIALAALLYGINPLSALIGSIVTALIVSTGAQRVAWKTNADINTVLAIFWTSSFAGGLLILKSLNQYINIEHYLFGNILSVSHFDIWFLFIVGYLICSTVILLQRKIIIMAFSKDDATAQGINVQRLGYLMAAMLVIVMITSLQAVGTILTLGLLVAPAAIISLFVNSPRCMLWGGGITGAVLAAGCVFISNTLNVQTGALIVLLLGFLFIVAAVIKSLIASKDTTSECEL